MAYIILKSFTVNKIKKETKTRMPWLLAFLLSSMWELALGKKQKGSSGKEQSKPASVYPQMRMVLYIKNHKESSNVE